MNIAHNYITCCHSVPRLIALEVTRRCHLKCQHCRAGSSDKTAANELTLDEIKKTFENISEWARPIIILTGGEPLLRPDLFDIIKLGVNAGFKMTLATCCWETNSTILRRLKEAPVERISLSLDSALPLRHDIFRGQKGSFDRVLGTAKMAREIGLPFQVNTTVSKNNMYELQDILKLAINMGAISFHAFFLVPTGRAKNSTNVHLTRDEYQTALQTMEGLEKGSTIDIKVTCAPQYNRLAGKTGKGCLAGNGFAFISSTGRVQTCGFLDLECGDLRKSSCDFKKIWHESEVFNNIRDENKYTGKCGVCDYHGVCGGCRARAFAVTGNYMADEPFCGYKGDIS